MADDRSKRGRADRALIALGEAHEVAYWSKKFKVTPAKLRAAVKKVGHSARKVEAYFAEQRHKARDAALIAISQPYEVQYWSKKFKVTPARLRAAVGKVGHSSKKVGAYLALLKHRARDKALIALSQPHEVKYWSGRFKVTPARLKAAVRAVGRSSKRVGEHLKASGKAAGKTAPRAKTRAGGR